MKNSVQNNHRHFHSMESRRQYTVTMGFLAAVLLGFLLTLYPFVSSINAQHEAIPPRILDREEQANVNVFRRASPSVVHISTQKTIAAQRGNLTLNLGSMPLGTGSGFLWDTQGHVVTNYHVIEDSDRVQVKLSDGTEWDAEILGKAPEFDVAVLKINAPANRLKALSIGRSDNLEVGQKVYAIGNPFGLDQTLTTGIVSGLGREIDSRSGDLIRGVIQTDAAINPGNSGGPLLDSQGKLIGVNTAIVSRSGASAGVGFAVPVNTVRATVPILIRGQNVNRGFLGLALAPQQVSRQATDEGVLILGVAEDSPSDQAGLRATRRNKDGEIQWGDVVVSIDGLRVTDSEALQIHLQEHQAGEEVTLGIKRQGEYSRITLTLAERPQRM